MEPYIPYSSSAGARFGADTAAIVRLLGEHFMAENPPVPYTMRTFYENGIRCDRKARYIFDFFRLFPSATHGSVAAALGNLYCAKAKASRFRFQASCPARLLLNGALLLSLPEGGEEIVSVSLNEGMNLFAVLAEKTDAPFLCTLQNAMPQWEPCCYIMPCEDRGGAAGFIYRLFTPAGSPVDEKTFFTLQESTGWLPEPPAPLQEDGLFAMLCRYHAREAVSLEQLSVSSEQLFVDKQASTLLPAGDHELQLIATLPKIRALASALSVSLPFPVQGECSPYLVLGPLQSTDTVIQPPLRVTYDQGQPLVWRPDLANWALRPYVEAFLFGRWTYPLGVTLYGMIRSAKAQGDKRMLSYAKQHLLQVTGVHDYALYDTARYGFAGVNQQICWLDALDDCGSFGSLTLEYDPAGENADIRSLAETIARYMMTGQVRTAEGAFQRRDDTIWADDMYMSVPFLCRYARMSRNEEALTFAAEQLLHYRRLLFMPQQGLMGHMRCLSYSTHNHIPWSRGNGWVLFSLSEILTVMPACHPLRTQLIDFFCALSYGFLRVQDDCGLLHQVLDDPESYLQTSATAMMICAFCRGIRNGWYSREFALQAEQAAGHAWQGLSSLAIDREGNLYGVCRGSGFSYDRAYYRALSWNFNDTHGIGIVMLAGTEWMETQHFLSVR